MSRQEAKRKLHDFLLQEADLDPETREELQKQRTFLDLNTIVIGQTGFLSPVKQSESLFEIKDKLQEMLPGKKLAAVRIGSTRDDFQKAYVRKLRSQNGNDRGKLLIDTLLPHKILPLAQRAFDINFYWPNECTQSGVMAHALGTGAVIAGRDLEGVGETLKEAGQIVDTDMNSLLHKMRDIIDNPVIAEKAQDEALKYASQLSWRKQAKRHYELAEEIVHPAPVSPLPLPSLTRIRPSAVFSKA
jgi:glycosyltransferase involved in cell wall biosynthesis